MDDRYYSKDSKVYGGEDISDDENELDDTGKIRRLKDPTLKKCILQRGQRFLFLTIQRDISCKINVGYKFNLEPRKKTHFYQ